MSDALLVCSVQRIANLRGILQRLIERQRPLQRRPLDVLHNQVIRSDIVQRADVRMVQRSDSPRFALEAFAELALGNFQGDDAVQSTVAGLVHVAHATRA